MIMERLDTIVSAVGTYADRLGISYTHLSGDAENVRSEVSTMEQNVANAERACSNQVYKAKEMQDDAQVKERQYHSLAEDARFEMERARQEVEYVLNNPRVVTETDSEGNTTTYEEIDQAALAAAQRELDRATTEYYHYYNLYMQAAQLAQEAAGVVSKFEMMHKAIQTVAQSLAEERQRIDRYSQQIQEEANHNLLSVKDVHDRMCAYLSCKRIYRP